MCEPLFLEGGLSLIMLIAQLLHPFNEPTQFVHGSVCLVQHFLKAIVLIQFRKVADKASVTMASAIVH